MPLIIRNFAEYCMLNDRGNAKASLCKAPEIVWDGCSLLVPPLVKSKPQAFLIRWSHSILLIDKLDGNLLFPLRSSQNKQQHPKQRTIHPITAPKSHKRQSEGTYKQALKTRSTYQVRHSQDEQSKPHPASFLPQETGVAQG